MLTKADLKQLAHLLRPLSTRIANTVARAVVQFADDSTKLQLAQLGVLAGETVDNAEHFQPYGFASVPLAGAEGVVLFPNADRSHPILIVASDRRSRPTANQPGEVTVYNAAGASVKLTKDGDIIGTPAAGRKIKLGSAAAADPPARSSELAALKSAIASWTPVPNDGGASLKTVFSGWSVPGAAKVTVE